ncbi:MAG TPA: MFS transporter [Thermoleophilaceae bacterium]
MTTAAPAAARRGLAFLAGFGVAAAGVGAARALTTSYVPVLLDRIREAPGLIGAVMLVNAVAGFGIPIAVGVWSDRRGGGRLGRRLPFVIGGAALTAAGLVAIALGTTTSYAYLALAAAIVYVGLNTAATAHRAIVVDSFTDGDRPAATSAQEVAMLLGGMVALGAGAAIVEGSAPALFAIGAVLAAVLVVPTVLVVRRRLPDAPRAAGDVPGATDAVPGAAAAPDAPAAAPAARPRLRDLAATARTPGAREVLLAQILWLVAYGALPAFFLLYADHALGVGPGPASALPAGFGVLTGAAMVAAGRARPERVLPLLVAGAALLGGGLVAAAAATTLAAAALPFAAGAVGLGLVTALGFPYFARFVPEGESGRYTGLYFAVRAIGSAVTLPAAGLLIALTGSYRVLPLLGAAALLSLVPLARAARLSRPGPAPAAPRPVRTVAAVVPCHLPDRLEDVVAAALPHVDGVVVVADGTPAGGVPVLDRLRATPGVEVLALGENAGKGDAVAAGAAAVLARDERPDAIVVLDADGQHPPDRIPALAEAAATADVVIGDRSGDRDAMPRTRRVTNAASSALLGLRLRRRLPDSQCGMRLIRTEALDRVPLPAGRYEAETVHLLAAVRFGLRVAWAPIPAIYDGEPSSFRPLADTARVLRAIAAPAGRGPAASRERGRERRLRAPSRAFWRQWGVRLGAVVAATMALGAVMPALAPVDERLFVAVNSLGAGPDWLYDALDPHSRNYLLLGLAAVAWAAIRRTRTTLAVAFAVAFAGVFSDLLVQAVYLLYDRPRPEEVHGLEVLLVTPERSWAHIASFPSGHLVVTTAIAVAGMSLVPALRSALWLYVGAIALTRITFGAHFPLDVLMGAVFGYEVGRFSAWLPHAIGLAGSRPASALPQLAVPWRARPASTGTVRSG